MKALVISILVALPVLASTPNSTMKFCMNPKNKLVDDSTVKSTNIEALPALDGQQNFLISDYLASSKSDFQEWSYQHNDRVSTFLSVTHALRMIEVQLDSSKSLSGLDLIDKIVEVRGDRLMATLFF